MKRPIIFPYSMGSNSCRNLVEALRPIRGKRVRAIGNYRPYRNHLIVNWGNSTTPTWFDTRPYGGFELNLLNTPLAVERASNKLQAFTGLSEAGILIPSFTTSIETARDWQREGNVVLCRNLLRASAGRGIVVVGPEEDLEPSPLYVKYVKKKREYRIHVFNNLVIDVTQKRTRTGADPEDVNYQIRSHENGWVFVRDSIMDYDESFGAMAVNAVRALGLDFGAVDLIYNTHYRTPLVLEVNTAPGLEGRTVEVYADAIRSKCNG